MIKNKTKSKSISIITTLVMTGTLLAGSVGGSTVALAATKSACNTNVKCITNVNCKTNCKVLLKCTSCKTVSNCTTCPSCGKKTVVSIKNIKDLYKNISNKCTVKPTVKPPVKPPVKPTVPPTTVPPTTVPPTTVPPTTVPPTTVPPTTPDTNGISYLSNVENDILSLVNVERQKVGAKPLKFNTTANKYARSKSAEMITLNYFAHESPKNGTIMDIAKKDGWKYSLIGENIYTSTGITDVKAKAIVDGWMSSPGHRENILRAGYEEIGIGVAIKGNKVMATQIFYTPAN